MDASLYFQLADAIACVSAPQELADVAAKVAGTEMYPLERRVLERALRARAAAVTLQKLEASQAARSAAMRAERAPARG